LVSDFLVSALQEHTTGGTDRNSFLRSWTRGKRLNTKWFLPPEDARGKINGETTLAEGVANR
jgi:hypothetical protein